MSRKQALQDLRDARIEFMQSKSYHYIDLKSKLSQETKVVLMAFAKEVHDSLEKHKFINLVAVEAFFNGFMQQDGITVREYMINNASNGYRHCGWSLEFTMDYLEGVIGTRPHFEFWPYMEDCTNIGLVVRKDLQEFESSCKPCYDLRLNAITSNLMCGKHTKSAVTNLKFHSKEVDDVSFDRVKSYHDGYRCDSHCFSGNGCWIFAIKEDDINADPNLKSMSERSNQIMSSYEESLRNTPLSENNTSLKKQKVN